MDGGFFLDEFKNAITMTKPTDILNLTISAGVNGDSALYRLKRGTILRIVPSVSLLGRHVALYCNYPVTDEAEFIRKQYVHLNWFRKNGKKITDGLKPFAEIDDVDIYCEIEVNRSGTFHFYFIYEECDVNEHQGSLYVQVEPIIKVGPPTASKILPLDSIRCQTVLSKLLGPISTWENKLLIAKHSGYNLIHFTPIQQLGGSRSCYSLQDQLKVNPEFANITNGKSSDKSVPFLSFDEVERVIMKIRQEWNMASICDIVLNHTANESTWIQEHPEVTYSCFTCPHLRPTFLLDSLLAQLSNDVAGGLLETVGVPIIIENDDHIQAIRHQLHTVYLPKINLFEFYQCNIEKYITEFLEAIRSNTPPSANTSKPIHKIDIVLTQDPEYKRLGCTIDLKLALEKYNIFRPDSFDEDTRIRKCTQSFRVKLEHLNETIRLEVCGYLNNAVENCLAAVRYERVQHDGPQFKEINYKHPLFSRYFTDSDMSNKKSTLQQIEDAMYTNNGKYFMAHNGWVMNADPLQDFARQPTTGIANVYLKRELIAWGDSVKLRYGDGPEDNPYLWNHMKSYVDTTAKIFDGVRLDNCHSTPLHVAEYLLDSARKINKELYVVAELFTNSDLTDNIFVNRLGITSLIREAQSAWDPHEEGRLVYRFGGAPVGAFYPSPKRSLAPGIAHALFLDLTHDNPSPIEKRSVFDILPTAALVSMACCATGSNRGSDELVPHHIHVVDEERQYQEWEKGVDSKSGIIAARRALNELHGEMAEKGFSEIFVDQMDPNIVAVTRHSPTTHQTVILIAHTSFANPEPNAGPTGIRPLRFEGTLDEIILEAELNHNSSGKPFDRPYNFEKDKRWINGLNEYELKINEHIPLCQSNVFRRVPTRDGNITQLDLDNLRPGSVVAIRVSIHDHTQLHFDKLQELLNGFHSENGKKYTELKEIISKMNLIDLNRAIYHCDQEERDMGKGIGTYNIPGFGPLVYCGFQGFISLLTEIAPINDLGHPFCNNLRQGDWMIDYVHQRLNKSPGTVDLAKWLDVNSSALKQIPRYLIPSYFDVLLTGVHNLLTAQCYNLMSDFVRNGNTFIQNLAMGSVQFISICESANLPKLSPTVKSSANVDHFPTLSAGLPHFSTGYMRCWGRDTFIAMRGILFLTGRWTEARHMILGFAGCLRHGLIPNLLDNGYKPRFNCRDAVWWWLYSIKLFVDEAPNGQSILSENVSRIFPTDDSEPKTAGEYDQPLYDVMQEALTVHFQGLQYRERNAGREIDEHMVDRGFNNQIGIHPETGFVFGGNDSNCGTWMDKMGSSDRAGNRGRPSTPRDGSAIELIGLQMATLRFMDRMSELEIIPHRAVQRFGKNDEQTTWTYIQWADLIQANFERHFYVGHEGGPLVNKKGIYKDSLNASQPWTEFQLRCNFPITMVTAPELFDPKHAWEALEQAKKYLLGPLGMKTLDPEDWAYHGFYDNSNDSDDPKVSHGANYHQGPEWVWPIGFYLRARLIFAGKTGHLKETIAETWSILKAHFNEIHKSHWRGLPELTNENGAYCSDSCRTQAWSMSTVLEVLYDLHKLESVK